MNKQTLRKQIKQSLNKMTENERKEKSNKIANKLFETEEFKNADVIGITISFKTEVRTKEIIEKCFELKKIVAVPKIDISNKKMYFYEIKNFYYLEKNITKNNIILTEPNINICKKIESNQINLLIVPGLLFDENFNRLGYGGGFYDRFLDKNYLPNISIAYQIQVVKEIPIELHDKKINSILTENNFYKMNMVKSK
ncbi:MAG: 5-formyltetrahydrofolate cyclo-ligase [Defluviitaleaceae bacterium]|nr:5-formyltetrahydrofolate cyclo-ligase [Defluviitaleaceae bacterium]